MKKKLAKFSVLGVGLLLVVYGAVRSYDFISLTVPPDRQWWALAGLAASELGMLAWLVAFLWDEGSSSAQNAIAIGMMVIDFLGSIALSSADMFLVSADRGLILELAPETVNMILIGLAALVAINVGAGLAHLASDPGAARARAQREAFAQIEDEALVKIRENANVLAAELGKAIADDWKARTRVEYRNRIASSGRSEKELPPATNAFDAGNPPQLEEPNPTSRQRKK